jgi:hypothetical protein
MTNESALELDFSPDIGNIYGLLLVKIGVDSFKKKNDYTFPLK